MAETLSNAEPLSQHHHASSHLQEKSTDRCSRLETALQPGIMPRPQIPHPLPHFLPHQPGTSSANTSLKCLATPLKVLSIASSLRMSSALGGGRGAGGRGGSKGRGGVQRSVWGKV